MDEEYAVEKKRQVEMYGKQIRGDRSMNVQQIARICHEANRAYCESIDDYSQNPWESAAPWQRESAVKGVEYRMDNPDAPHDAQHNAWSADKLAAGWTWGAVKDEAKKEHPCLVFYSELPVEQRLKDYLFQAIVSAFQKANQE